MINFIGKNSTTIYIIFIFGLIVSSAFVVGITWMQVINLLGLGVLAIIFGMILRIAENKYHKYLGEKHGK